MGEFPSGQRGQTVNLLAVLSVVRIHLPPPRSAVVHDTMGYRTFLFFCRRSPYIKRFSEYGGAKVLNARIFLFYRRCAADFCFAPPNEENQIVDRFIKRLQRKIKLFLDIYLLRFSSSPGRVNVPADFDTIEKAFSGVKTAEKSIKQGLSRSNADFESPCLLYSVIDFCRSKVRRHREV